MLSWEFKLKLSIDFYLEISYFLENNHIMKIILVLDFISEDHQKLGSIQKDMHSGFQLLPQEAIVKIANNFLGRVFETRYDDQTRVCVQVLKLEYGITKEEMERLTGKAKEEGWHKV